ncbi:MAG: hypothetical protein R3C03_02750 [Pirellulaceae bacterium]
MARKEMSMKMDLRRMTLARQETAKYFSKKKWPKDSLDDFDFLFYVGSVFGEHSFDLRHPGFKLMRDNEDTRMTLKVCGDRLLPIGICPNGDMICLAPLGFGSIPKGGVVFLCRELFGWKKKPEDYVRLVSSSISHFLSNIEKMPEDAIEGSSFDGVAAALGRKPRK